MSTSITVTVDPLGGVSARCWQDGGAITASRGVDLRGLDGQVVRLFEHWLHDRERRWTREEIRVFGLLLHRMLISDDLWSWLRGRLTQASRAHQVRVALTFPADEASSRLAALPWEYLHAPDRDGNLGRHLVQMPGVLLSRSVLPGSPDRAELAPETLRILPVVGDAENTRLGGVDVDPVLRAVDRAAENRADITVLPAVRQATVRALAEAVAEHRPHVVHYLGHGRFRDDTARGALALCADEGGTRWVDEELVAEVVCPDDWAPALVVLHACEGGRTDLEYRHAGLAPALVRRGAQCAVAMQYAVTNDLAVRFSTAFYDRLATGACVDEAVEEGRRAICAADEDARLVGIPMVYQRTAVPLFAPHSSEGADAAVVGNAAEDGEHR